MYPSSATAQAFSALPITWAVFPLYVPISRTNHHFGTGCPVLSVGWFCASPLLKLPHSIMQLEVEYHSLWPEPTTCACAPEQQQTGKHFLCPSCGRIPPSCHTNILIKDWPTLHHSSPNTTATSSVWQNYISLTWHGNQTYKLHPYHDPNSGSKSRDQQLWWTFSLSSKWQITILSSQWQPNGSNQMKNQETLR